MSSETRISFQQVWKKYSRKDFFQKSIRQDLADLFLATKKDPGLGENEFWVFQDLSFDVATGECLGLMGPNGSGKSTILKLIANVTLPTRGSVTVRGRVAPLLELGAGFHLDLTGRENIYMNGTILGMTIGEVREKEAEIIAFSGIKEFIDTPVKKYSSGMHLRLGFAIAVHSSADIYLFDEIMAVGDESFQEKCRKRIRELLAAGKTILFVSHSRELVHDFTDRVITLDSHKKR